jgi:hypothetical protein
MSNHPKVLLLNNNCRHCLPAKLIVVDQPTLLSVGRISALMPQHK